MSKKIISSIVVVVFLAAVQGIFAEDWYDNPQPKRQHRQFQNPRQGRRGLQSGQKQFGQQFDKCLDELTEAYEDNDREKMGQLIKKMRQRREKMRERRNARSKFRQGSRHSGYGQRGRGGQLRGGQYGYGQGLQGGNADGRGYGFQRRRTYGWGQSRPHQKMGRRQGRHHQYPDVRNQQQDSEGFDWDW